MPNEICAHCGVPIIYEETMVKRDGKTYCCRNCAAVHEPADLPGRDQEMREDAERSMAAASREAEPRPNRPEARGRQYR